MGKEKILELSCIHKRFPGVYALNDIHFDLYAGEVHALLGENGAGKSTLVKIISGVYDYSQGTCRFIGKDVKFKSPSEAIQKGISVIYQELNLIKNLSIAENIYYSHMPRTKTGRVKWNEVYKQTTELLSYIGLNESPKKKVGYLPMAKQQLVEIAKAISLDAKVIIMDEPTSALSPTEIENLFRIINDLKSRGIGIIYISHKIDEIFEIADRATVLRDGKYIGTENVKDLTQDKIVSMMVGRELTDMYPKQPGKFGDTVFEVKNLTTLRVKDISFHVKASEIVGFSGLMGAGRTELAQAIVGADKRLGGEIFVKEKPVPKDSTRKASKMGIGYVPEDRKAHGILGNLSVKKNMTISAINQFWKGWRIDKSAETKRVNEMVDKLAIKTPSLEQLIPKLSGGNQQKVLLARFLLKDDLQVMIVDEPTRGIDVGAKAEIYAILDKLAHQGMAIIIMSSEMPEILSMCDRIYTMKNGRITGELRREEASQEELFKMSI